MKHSGVRAAVHRDLVKTGLLSSDWGRFYDQLFQERQQGDYIEFVSLEAADVATLIEKTTQWVDTLEGLLSTE